MFYWVSLMSLGWQRCRTWAPGPGKHQLAIRVGTAHGPTMRKAEPDKRLVKKP
jgi:hypothetical protein